MEACWRNGLLHTCGSRLRKTHRAPHRASSRAPGFFALPADSARVHLAFDLRGRFELNRIDPLLASSNDKGLDVVRIKALLGAASGTLNGRAENLRFRLHRVHLVRQNQIVKMSQEAIFLADRLEMDFIGIR